MAASFQYEVAKIFGRSPNAVHEPTGFALWYTEPLGFVSELVNTPNGGLLVVLEKRETIDPAQFAKERPKLESRALESQAQVVFYEWLRQRRQQAGVPETKSPAAPG